MRRWRAVPLVVAAAAGLAACAIGASDIDYSRERGISDDISAVHKRGSTALRPGTGPNGEPLGAYPWALDQRHPTGR